MKYNLPVFLTTMLLLSFTARAGDYPVITSSSSTNYLTSTIVNWDTVQSSVPAGLAYNPNMTYNPGFGIILRSCRNTIPSPTCWTDPSAPPNLVTGGVTVAITLTDTWQDAINKFIDQKGRFGTVSINLNTAQGNKNPQVCFGAFANSTGSTVDLYPKLLPGSCSSIVTSPNKCDITSNLLLDYNNISPESVNGSKQSGQVFITCDQPANVNFRVIPEVTSLGLGITSMLTINGNSPTTAIDVLGSKSVIIESTLTSLSTPASGRFGGTTIVLVDIQ